MNVPPSGSKGDEENGPPPRRMRRPARRILGANYNLPHSNSPTKYKRGNGSGSPSRREMRKVAKDEDHHVHWEEGTFSASSLIGDLDDALAEQRWSAHGNGVYMPDGAEHPPDGDGIKTKRSPKSERRRAGKDRAVDGRSCDSFPVGQRSGLHRRFSAEASKESGGIVEDNGTPSPNRPVSRRSVRARSFHPKFSAISKRRAVVLLLALGLGLAMLGYFVELRQMIMITHSGSVPSDWIMSFPRSFSSSILGSGSAKDYGMEALSSPRVPAKIVSMEAELKHVQYLSKKRAESRRARTRPPSAHPTIPAAGAASFVDRDAPSGSNLPRLTLDLPAHRELNNVLVDHRSLQANNDDQEGRRQLLRKKAPPKEQTKPCGPHAREASRLNPDHFPPSAYVGPKSRVVVTGAMTQLGMEVILQLHEVCQVEFIVGIDAAYPNTRHERIDMVESRYKYLSRRIPGFQRLIVPVFGVHPHPGIGEEERLEEVGNGFDLVGRLKPTHVVHLAGMEEGRGEHTDYGDTRDATPFAATGNSGMMRRFDSLLSMEQALSALAKFNESPEGGDLPQPQLVYVSSNEAGNRSGVKMQSEASVPRASVYGTSNLVKEALASYYHRHHGVDSVGLRVPTIFGPFSRSGSFLNDLAERTVRNAVGKDVDGVPGHRLDRHRYELPHMWSLREGATSGATEQLLYVYDAASAIISAMQFKKAESDDGPTIMKIGSKLTASMNDIKERMEGHLPPAGQVDIPPTSFPGEAQETNALLNSPGLSIYDAQRNRNLLGWSSMTELHEGTKSMLAWEILKEYPFGLPESMPRHSTFLTLLEDTRPSLSYHTLPCAAGCRWGGGMCSKSKWDGVIETAHEITKTCPYVLYTVDLRPELAKMEKEPAPSQREGWEDHFCKIAFVSSSSKLAAAVYRDQLKEKAPMNEWNGKGKVGHWIIVVLKGTYYSMPEYERALAKLSPSKLFADSVSKAMYINHRRVVLSTDQAMGVMRHMEMNERKSSKKHTIVDEKTGENKDIYLPPQPHRHSVLFTNKYSFSDGYDTSSARNLARFVMANAGIAETKDMRAQTQFYEETGHLTRTNMQRSPNYQEFYQENFFPYDFLRSTWLVHELRSAEGRRLRCEMYEEHALWGNADMEDMSMGYVLARRKVKAQLGKAAEPQYEGPEEWYPLLVPREPDEEGAIKEGPVYLDYLEAAQKVSTDTKGHEYYVTFLPQKRKE